MPGTLSRRRFTRNCRSAALCIARRLRKKVGRWRIRARRSSRAQCWAEMPDCLAQQSCRCKEPDGNSFLNVKAQPELAGLFVSGCCTREFLECDFCGDDLLQRRDESLILLWSSDGDADRGGRSPASGERTNDDAFLLEVLAHSGCALADFAVDEVRPTLDGIQSEFAHLRQHPL